MKMHPWETDQNNRGWAIHQTEQSMQEFQHNAMTGPIDQILQAIKILWWNQEANKSETGRLIKHCDWCHDAMGQ